MSLFETLKKAIFYNPMARGTTQAHSTPASTTPANTTRVASAPSAGAASASRPASPQPASPQPAQSPAQPAAQASVDVEEVLEALNAKSSQKLNWRTSIVDLMKLVGLDSSLHNRQQLAKELGYTGDPNDSAAMNIWLHKAVMKKLAENGGKVPASLQ
jgi:hypothetical protein